jgi:hypothetical protein
MGHRHLPPDRRACALRDREVVVRGCGRLGRRRRARPGTRRRGGTSGLAPLYPWPASWTRDCATAFDHRCRRSATRRARLAHERTRRVRRGRDAVVSPPAARSECCNAWKAEDSTGRKGLTVGPSARVGMRMSHLFYPVLGRFTRHSSSAHWSLRSLSTSWRVDSRADERDREQCCGEYAGCDIETARGEDIAAHC